MYVCNHQKPSLRRERSTEGLMEKEVKAKLEKMSEVIYDYVLDRFGCSNVMPCSSALIKKSFLHMFP